MTMTFIRKNDASPHYSTQKYYLYLIYANIILIFLALDIHQEMYQIFYGNSCLIFSFGISLF